MKAGKAAVRFVREKDWVEVVNGKEIQIVLSTQKRFHTAELRTKAQNSLFLSDEFFNDWRYD